MWCVVCDVCVQVVVWCVYVHVVLCWWCVGVVCVCMWCCAWVLCGGGGGVRCVHEQMQNPETQTRRCTLACEKRSAEQENPTSEQEW